MIRTPMPRAPWRARLLAAVVLSLAAAAPAAAQAGRRTTVADPNTAAERDIAALPHMTPALARAVVAGRPYASQTALNQALARSLTPAQVAELAPRFFVQVDLNTASDAEIRLVPGVGPRMLHEFKEYRPYRHLSQFHREIDKYVDDAELARLEQYVFVPMDLNSASDADLLTIPNLGPRMLREFKEYRPYANLARFRREIGKYVDAKEVARLERYVVVGPAAAAR